MRRKSREINIFNMSALDLFASALGAFILIALVLFPFFPNITDKDLRELLAEAQRKVTEVRQELTETKSELATTNQELTNTQNELADAKQELRKKFLLVMMTWGRRGDVDLYVRDPQGRIYFYKNKIISGSNAAMEVDNIHGPGNEIWLHPQATPGDYEICYHYYEDRNSGSVQVKGAYITPGGRREFPSVTLAKYEMRQIATININSEGKASYRPSSASRSIIGSNLQGLCGITFVDAPKY